MPLHNSHVVHPFWSDVNAKVSTNAMDSRCEIFISVGDFDRETGATVGEKTVFYSGICRVFPTAVGRTFDSAGQYVPTRQFTVAIPRQINNIKADHFVRIIESKDQSLLNRLFIVREIARATFVWERHLIVSEDQAYENSI